MTEDFTVFVAIPVFNRISDTLKCIECLQAQTISNLKIIIADGGSTDDSPNILKDLHPEVIVLECKEPLWWAGSTRMAIDWALENTTSDRDYVLMLNNDTIFEPGYVAALLRHSKAHNTAVCGVVVDEDDNDHIIDAGVSFNWEGYAFVGNYTRPKNETINLTTCVLPGRGTLIPVKAIQLAGNVDDRHFPHYLADYEFTYRLKRDGGIGMAVAYDVSVQTKVNPPEEARPELGTFKEVRARAAARFKSRSKQNCIDHLWFVYLHAPGNLKMGLLFRILAANGKFVLAPLAPRKNDIPILREFVAVVGNLIAFGRRILRMIFGPYLINTTDVAVLGLDVYKLGQHEIIKKSRFEDYYYPARTRGYVKNNYPEAIKLYGRASSPLRKLYRFLDSRGKATYLNWIIQKTKTAFGPYLITQDDINNLGLDLDALIKNEIIAPSRFPDYFIPTRTFIDIQTNYPHVVPLYELSMAMHVKLFRIFASRYANWTDK